MHCLRLALAGLVAAVSLLQMPSMVMAESGSVARQHGHSIASHNHHELAPSHHRAHGGADSAVDATGDAPSVPACHIAGCCLALNPVILGAPSTFCLALGPLALAVARVMAPAAPDPADPPPRLQA